MAFISASAGRGSDCGATRVARCCERTLLGYGSSLAPRVCRLHHHEHAATTLRLFKRCATSCAHHDPPVAACQVPASPAHAPNNCCCASEVRLCTIGQKSAALDGESAIFRRKLTGPVCAHLHVAKGDAYPPADRRRRRPTGAPTSYGSRENRCTPDGGRRYRNPYSQAPTIPK